MGEGKTEKHPAQKGRIKRKRTRTRPSKMEQPLLCRARVLQPGSGPKRRNHQSAKSSHLLTGEPDARKPPVRFGRRGGANQCAVPTPIPATVVFASPQHPCFQHFAMCLSGVGPALPTGSVRKFTEGVFLRSAPVISSRRFSRLKSWATLRKRASHISPSLRLSRYPASCRGASDVANRQRPIPAMVVAAKMRNS
jgi:hypothetical protein